MKDRRLGINGLAIRVGGREKPEQPMKHGVGEAVAYVSSTLGWRHAVKGRPIKKVKREKDLAVC